MDIKEMNMDQVEARLAEIRTALDEPAADLDALEKEIDELQARKAEIVKKAEERTAALKAIADKKDITPIQEERTKSMSFTPDSAEYRVAWLKRLKGEELNAEERAAMSTVDVVPTETENRILNRLKENALLKYIDLTNFKGYVDIPNYSTNGDAAWSSTNEQQDAIGHVALSLYQLIKTIEVPGKFAKVSIDAFETYIFEALTNKIETALQKAVIAGTGSSNSQPTGILTTVSSATGTFTYAGITKADILGIMGALGAQYQKDAVWIMPSKTFYECMANVDLPGFAALSADLKPVLCGKPVVIDDNCIVSTKDNILYGAAKAYHMNIGDSIEVSRDDSIGFKSNAINYRAVVLADGKLDSSSAFVRYERAAAPVSD